MEIVKYTMDYVIKDIADIIPYLPIGLAFGLAALIGIVSFQIDKKREVKLGYDFAYAIFAVYLVIMLEVALFSREPGTRDSLDLVLLGTWGETLQSRAYVIENVIMFIPYGMLLPVLVRKMRNPFWLVLASLGASVIIEGTQYVTKMGFCQIDDLVMNTLGGILGFFVFMAGYAIRAVYIYKVRER